MARIRIQKNGDGTFRVSVKRTRRDEKVTRPQYLVSRKDVGQVLGGLIAEARGETLSEPAEGS